MTRMEFTLLSMLFVLGLCSPAMAQLVAARDAPVAYGHHHINASDVEAHKRFWIDGLGGTSVKVGTSNAEIVRFPNVLVFLANRRPTGGTKGTVVNHVGFETPNIRAAVDRLKTHGFRIVTAEEVPPDYTVTDDIGQRPGGNIIAFVMGPDDVKVELLENRSISEPIRLHHIHWFVPDGPAVQAWYVKHFGAAAGTRINQPAADLPGVNLTFAPTTEPVVPTRGRSLDHIGFEVRNLEAFVKQLEAAGVKMDRPYTRVEALGIAIAFFTDPFGTYVELTEGLGAVQ
jgi:catechol 2,3-dioxygenase-like lactoylglutathione lyase family enzyme